MSDFERRLIRLETREHGGLRKVHVVKACDAADASRQVAALQALGSAGPRDGSICVTGLSSE
jgi:hypothetical protein